MFYIQDESGEIKSYSAEELPWEEFNITVNDGEESWVISKQEIKYIDEFCKTIESIRDKEGNRTHDTIMMCRHETTGKLISINEYIDLIFGDKLFYEQVEVLIRR